MCDELENIVRTRINEFKKTFIFRIENKHVEQERNEKLSIRRLTMIFYQKLCFSWFIV